MLLRIFLPLAAGFLLCGLARPALAAELWDVAAGRETSFAQAAEAVPGGALVSAGEQHDNPSHHMAQLEVIRALHATGRPLAVGLEMVQTASQPVLDAWVFGDLPESEMITAFQSNWGDSWLLYRPIFLFCRDKKIPLLGLNVPRAITRQVAREGFASLSPEQRGELPPVSCVLDPAYEQELRQVLGPHGAPHGRPGGPQASGGDDSGFTRFCEAQLVWDTSMAFHALEHQKVNPQATVVILCGFMHAWKRAMPAQIRRLSPTTPVVVFEPVVEDRLTRENAEPGDADYLFLDVQ